MCTYTPAKIDKTESKYEVFYSNLNAEMFKEKNELQC